jgi:hypothetical protein
MINKLVWKRIGLFILTSVIVVYISLLHYVVASPLPQEVRWLFVHFLYVVASFILGGLLFDISQYIEEEQSDLENQLKNRQEDEKEQDSE